MYTGLASLHLPAFVASFLGDTRADHACPQEREKLAYQAQERWLPLFGHSLEADFELDGFSLLGKTQCFY
jgi:hypothetical protein